MMRECARTGLCGVGVVAVLMAATMAACGSRGASYPDGDKVQAAQKAWCGMLAEILSPEGEADGWDDRSSCEGTYPTASAAFIAGMTDCFKTMVSREGGGDMNPRQMVADCTEQVLVDLGGEVRGLGITQARCERTARCQDDVTVEECIDAFENLPLSERSRLSTMYNWGAQEEIASCLNGGCSDDEDEAMVACYEDAHSERIWLPDE
ncbi:MAG: hypothetical protein JRI23_31910 [Deltaproteobacteria bacterium]|jgi:hypothetical protein|nr:hypothetical protein [Deltaproteobacteria bacterium]MBW2536830.1 hypothetical protein [Deltaproteobacteria bacterium]